MSAPMPVASSPPGEAAAGVAKAGTSADGAPFGLVFLVFTSCHSFTFDATSQCLMVGGAAGLTRVGRDLGTKEEQDHPGHAEDASQLQDRRCCLCCCCSIVIIIVTAHSGLLVQCCGLSNIWYSLSIDTCVNIPQMCKNLNMQESVKKENQHKNLLEIPDSV